MILWNDFLRKRSRSFFYFFIFVLLLGFQTGYPAAGADETGPRPPHPMPKNPSHPPRPRVPHGPSAPAEPFMNKLNGYNERLKKNPEDVEALIFLANSNFDIQRYEKAANLYLRILAIDPNNLHVRTDLASAYRKQGDSDKAVETLRLVLSLNPNHEVALYNIGIILLNDKEDLNGAADAWERLVNINPKDPLADALRKKVTQIRKGELKPTPSSK